MIFDKVIEQIDKGRDGTNQGLDNGFDRLNAYLFGVQKGTYYTLFGPTGSGKTAIADAMFVYNPYVRLKDKSKLKIIYYSLEISAERKIAKFMCRWLWENHGIVIDINRLFSRADPLPDTIYKKVLEAREFFREMEECLLIRDSKVSPAFIYKDLKTFAEGRGKFVEKDGKLDYYPDDPEEYVIIIFDHFGLIAPHDKKGAIDSVSQYLVWFRNKCGYIPVGVSQINRDSTSTGRRQTGYVDLQLSDMKDSGGPAEDSNVVISLFSPYREKQDNWSGYDVKKLKDRFRVARILKNRDAGAEVSIGLNFFGEIGYFKEMPKASEIDDIDSYLSL